MFVCVCVGGKATKFKAACLLSGMESVLPWDISKFFITFRFFTVDCIKAEVWHQAQIDRMVVYKSATLFPRVQGGIL